LKFANIQALRAIAVILVLAAHVHDFSDRFDSRWALDWLSPVGTWGVDLFFVISGFIMVVVHYNDFAVAKSPQRFFLRRIIRIYPLYWVVTFVILLILKVPGLAHGWAGNGSQILESLLLLPQAKGYLLPIAWTLTYEMYFYCVFAGLLLFSRSVALRVIAGWAAVILAMQFVPAVQNNLYGGFAFGNLVLEFILGAFVGVAVVKRRFVEPLLPLALGLLGLAITFAVFSKNGRATTEGSVRFATIGISMAAIVYGTAIFEVARKRILPRALQSIGDASYSVYLWHLLLLVAIGKLLTVGHIAARLPAPVVLTLVPLLVLGASIVLYHLVEVPLSAASKRLCARLFPDTMRRLPARIKPRKAASAPGTAYP
jgi:exopolysaccharide production protein ExoZ